jgi:hypothetical protein
MSISTLKKSTSFALQLTRFSVHCIIILTKFVFGQTLQHAARITLISTQGYLCNNSEDWYKISNLMQWVGLSKKKNEQHKSAPKWFQHFLYSKTEAFKKIITWNINPKWFTVSYWGMKYVLKISVYRYQVFAFRYRVEIYKKVWTLFSITYLHNTHKQVTYVTLTSSLWHI